MIKKILVLAICAVMLPLSGFAQKFGIVDSQEILEKMPETVKANETLQASQKKYEDEFKNLSAEFEKKYTELQNLPKDTPQAIADRRMQEAQDLQQKIETFRQTAANDLQKQQQQLYAPIIEKVRQAIQTVGKEGNYTFIFETGASIYSGTDVVDITTSVKAKLGMK